MKAIDYNIEVLRFPLAIMVVFIHNYPSEISAIQLGLSNLYFFFGELISHNIGRVVVPTFFFISGYYHFKNVNSIDILKWYKESNLRSLKKIIWLYVVWCLLYILIIWFKNQVFMHFGKSTDDFYYQIHNKTIYELIWGGPQHFPLWYLRDLICMMVISPLFYFLFKKTGFYGIILLAIIYLGQIESHIDGFSSTSLMFFGLGAFCKLNTSFDLLDFNLKFHRYNLPISILLLFLSLFFNGTDYYEYVIRVFVLFGTLSVLYIGQLLSKSAFWKNKLIYFAETTLFIYLIHYVYILLTIKGLIYRISFYHTNIGKVMEYFITPILTVGIILAIYYLLKKCAPRALNFLLAR